MLEPEKLTVLDYKILQFIADHSPVPEKQVLNTFSNRSATQLRRSILATPNFYEWSGIKAPLENTYYISYDKDPITDELLVCIEPLGLKVLEEYQYVQKTSSRKRTVDIILKVLPILISVIALVKSFWPDIIGLWKQLMQLMR